MIMTYISAISLLQLSLSNANLGRRWKQEVLYDLLVDAVETSDLLKHSGPSAAHDMTGSQQFVQISVLGGS